MRRGWEGDCEESRCQPPSKTDTPILLTILVEWVLSQSLSTVVEELLTELLCQLVGLTHLWSACVDVVLHVAEVVKVLAANLFQCTKHSLNQSWIGPVHDGNTPRGDLSVYRGQAPEDDVVEHDEGILSDPVPR